MNFRGNPTRKSTCGEWLNSSAVSLWLVRRAGIWFSAPKTGAQNHFLCGRTHTHRKSLKYLQPKKLRCFFSCCIVSLCAGGRRGRLFVSSLGLGWSLGLRVRLSCRTLFQHMQGTELSPGHHSGKGRGGGSDWRSCRNPFWGTTSAFLFSFLVKGMGRCPRSENEC